MDLSALKIFKPATQLEKKNALKDGRFCLFGMPALLLKILIS
jgi:hypothetical protein